MNNMVMSVVGIVATISAAIFFALYFKMIAGIRNRCKEGILLTGTCIKVRKVFAHDDETNSDRTMYVCTYDMNYKDIVLHDAHIVGTYSMNRKLFVKPEKKPEPGDLRRYYVNVLDDKKDHRSTFYLQLPFVQNNIEFWSMEEEANGIENWFYNIALSGTVIFSICSILMLIRMIG